MKKKLVFIVMILFIAASGTALFAQNWTSYNPSFQEGDIAVQGGIGLLPTWGYTGDVTILPLSVSVDYAMPISDFPLSFGGFFGFMTTGADFTTYKYNYTYLIFGARAAWHVDMGVENLDTYAGLMLGYNYFSYKWESSTYSFYNYTGSDGYLAFSGYVGARYFFTENIAAYGELGYGITILNLGVTFKF